MPLDNRNQISLSKEGPTRAFQSALRPQSNFSPVRAGGDFVTMPSSQHIDLQLKVRQLEMNLLDFKSLVDRKLMVLSEEIPAQVQREYKGLEIKQDQLIKDIGTKFASI